MIQSPLPSPPSALYLCLIALLQGSKVADEAHGQAAPLLSLGVLSQAVQQYPCVPSPSQQPQGLHLWEVVRLQRKSRKMFKRPFNGGHLGDSLEPSEVREVWEEICVFSGKIL